MCCPSLHGRRRRTAPVRSAERTCLEADHAIGIHAASLVKDGGTLQIGIGSLADAFTAGLIIRHRDRDMFRETLRRLCYGTIPEDRHTGGFETGVYAASEMFVDGFMEPARTS